MKRLLLLICTLLCANVLFAQIGTRFWVDGLQYEVTSMNPPEVMVYWYQNNPTNVVIPETVTYGATFEVKSIDASAFSSCSSLTSVTIPNSVTSIGYGAFSECSSLTSVTLPENITYIGENAFRNAGESSSIVVINSVGYKVAPTKIPESYYATLTDNSYTISDHGMITFHIGDSTYTPTEAMVYNYNDSYGFNSASISPLVGIDGNTYPVTSIGAVAFRDCDDLTYVYIPNSVTSIGNSAFYLCDGFTSFDIPESITLIDDGAFAYCSNLTSVNIGDSVTSIGNSAFSNCSSLTSITIPNSVTSIGNSAFSNCSSLTSITIPNSVTSIGEFAFGNCGSLTTLNFNAINCNVAFLFDGCPISTINIGDSVQRIPANFAANLMLLTSITIPNSVTSIGDLAFYNCISLTSVTIPNSVTSIGEWAFENCSSLTSITIPNSVTSIGGAVFYNCSGLTSVTLSNNITELPYCYDYYGSNAYGFFENCSSLTSINIPNSITHIGEYAFFNCSSLTSIDIPNSVTSIGEAAFYNCNSLTSIDIPNSVTSIGDYLFSGCSSLTSVTIGNSVTSIEDDTFEDCSSLTSVTIGNSVTSIGDYAFASCSSLTNLNYNAINCNNFDYYDHPFANCPISTINIGDSVQIIPSYFAYNLDSLTSVTIPNSVTSIGNGAFYDCSSLNSISIPNSVTSIGYGAFSECSSLTTLNFNAINCEDFTSDYYGHPFSNCPITTINIGNSVQRIPDYFAHNLYSLTSVTIPNSVTSIGDYAFYVCSSLTSVTIPNSVTSIGDGTFAGCYSLTSVDIPNSVISIGDWAFNGCDSLTSITIPNSVTSIIGEGAFAYCSSLTSVTIGNSVTSIGSSAFYYCSSLTSVTIGNSVTSIGYEAFEGCSSLTSITIPNSVTSIENSAFRGCSSLTSATIGNSVTSIGAYAFDGCSFLQNITCLAVVPPTMTFNNVFPYPNMAFVSVPCGSLSAYTAPTSFWNMFFMGRIQESNFAINLIVNNSEWGTVSMERTNCSTVILNATANEGYHFASWSDGETANPRTLVMTEDTEITAIFEEQEVITYNVTTGVNNEIMGSVEGAGIYVENTTATLTAVANYGYHFVAWSDGETANPRTITVTSDVNLTANFAINTYELVANVNDQAMGSVSGGGEYDYLSEVTLTAMANVGHHFVAWADGNTNNPRTIVLTSDTIITANFEVNTYTIIANVENDAMGNVSGGGEYTYGSTATLTAVPNACFSFVAWNDGNTENPRTITVSDNASLTASFEAVVYEHSFTANICEGTTYSENGFNVSEAGTYTQTFQTVNGCDSVVTLTLNVNPTFNTELSANICQGQVYAENGFNVSEAGVYTQTLTSVNGCDSIVTLSLNVNPTFNTELSATICQGQVYNENGFNVSEAGVYTQTLTSVNGCDSIVTLSLNVNPTFNTELSATICQGQVYNENGFNVSEAGVYTQTLTSANGCDSIVTLTLNVNPTFDTTINATINAGETYAEFGFNESEAGTYVQNLQSEAGCDSTITLVLSVNSSLIDIEETEITFYPNPTDSKITFSQKIEKVEVIDLTGKTIFTFSNAKTINIESLPSGAYYLRLTNEEKTTMQKVIKQ